MKQSFLDVTFLLLNKNIFSIKKENLNGWVNIQWLKDVT
jgi:hypothetical protein